MKNKNKTTCEDITKILKLIDDKLIAKALSKYLKKENNNGN